MLKSSGSRLFANLKCKIDPVIAAMFCLHRSRTVHRKCSELSYVG